MTLKELTSKLPNKREITVESLGKIPKKGKRSRDQEEEEESEEWKSEDDFESPKGKKGKTPTKSKKPPKSKKQKLTALLTTPTPQEIELFMKRAKKEKGARPVESAAAKAQRLALAPLPIAQRNSIWT